MSTILTIIITAMLLLPTDPEPPTQVVANYYCKQGQPQRPLTETNACYTPEITGPAAQDECFEPARIYRCG